MSTPTPEFAPWLGVFETLRVVRGKPLFLDEHGAELRRAMLALGLTRDVDLHIALSSMPGRLRWIVTATEARTLFTEEEIPAVEAIRIGVSPVRVGSANWDARFKTISYLSHAQARREAATPEVVLLNEHGHVASAASSNIFWRRGERLFTPAHEAGCRCGVVRGFVLGQEKVEAGHFPLSDLLAADEVFLTNSMRGIISVSRVEGMALSSSEAADKLRAAYEAEVARQVG
jgi:branched-subunit amino acid aminotransferase/4-amino-4-deoxychorismate lyase